MREVSRWARLDDYLPRAVRTTLEETLWRPIEMQATLEVLMEDPSFFEDPGRHPAMFADHGVVHVRDVASGVVALVDVVDGVLLAARPTWRRHLVQSWGVALAYLHDVGMVDLSPVGRRTHALYAAHAAFSADATPLVDHLLGPGPVREGLDAVQANDPFRVPLDTVVREVLSLAAAHSKSTVPAEALDDRPHLRRLMRRIAFTSMEAHRTSDRGLSAEHPALPTRAAGGVPHPSAAEAYAWLDVVAGPQRQLADDVIDAVRALRAADVLRQRGTALRTTGGFEVFFDARTGQAVCTFRPADGRAAYVMTYDDHRGAGEANIRMASITARGNLRIAFHRGGFREPSAARRAAESVANAIIDIQADVLPTFSGTPASGLPAPWQTPDAMLIQLERPDDDATFADAVRDVLRAATPELAGRVRVVADVEGATPAERRRFDAAEPLEPRSPLADRVLDALALHGMDVSGIDRIEAFTEVGRATVPSGEVLVEKDSPPAFVYVPLTEGLRVRPGGGYPPSELRPWVPVGTTGAVRRAGRNAEIVAEDDVDVLIIPSESYVRSWLRPFSPAELRRRLLSGVAGR